MTNGFTAASPRPPLKYTPDRTSAALQGVRLCAPDRPRLLSHEPPEESGKRASRGVPTNGDACQVPGVCRKQVREPAVTVVVVVVCGE